VDDNRKRAFDNVRPMVAQYIREQPLISRANGIHPDVIQHIEQALPQNPTLVQLEQVARIVPDEAVQLITASGTPDDCKAKIREYIQAGATYPVLSPVNTDIRSFIDTFANGY
jgi:5,10-methylenetetrahydromethanopterin reductase